MQSLFNFIVKPKKERYDNKKYIGDSELLLNTEISDHQYISRIGTVTSVPKFEDTKIQKGDDIIIHHNVFRRWYDMRGVEKNSRSYYMEDKYFVSSDQIFLYKQNNKWLPQKGFCWVKPIKNKDKYANNETQENIGIIKYTDGSFEVNDLVGFTPISSYEFVIDGELLYRVYTKFITIKYEYQGNEEAYNPSWAQGS